MHIKGQVWLVFVAACVLLSACDGEPEPTRPIPRTLVSPDALAPPPTSERPRDKVQTRTIAGIEMVWIPPGTFKMGGPSDEDGRGDDEGPQHQVRISNGFWLGKYEVVQAQWEAVMNRNPSEYLGDDLPVEGVSWNDCQEFIKKLNTRGQGCFRLPTEAEWEYACRAGSTTAYCFGDETSRLGGYAWYSLRKSSSARPVGQKRSNAWGLHDMHGNVWEWCQDWWEEDYYEHSPGADPCNSTAGAIRVLRGGSRYITPGLCRSANRGGNYPATTRHGNGFRLCCSFDEGAQ